MTTLDNENCMILIIDIQEKLLNAAFNRDIITKNATIIASAGEILHIPAIITEQYPKGLGSTAPFITNNITNRYIFEKSSFSAMDHEYIKNTINNFNKKQIILMGIETHICVYQTAQSLINLGYEVFVISNACGSRAESEHIAGLERIKDIGGSIITTEIALFELLKTSKHPNFKEIQSLIK